MGSSQQLSKPSAKPCHNWPSPRHSLTTTDHDWPDNAVGDWMMLCPSIKQIINWELDGNSRISHLYILENTFHALFLNVCSYSSSEFFCILPRLNLQSCHFKPLKMTSATSSGGPACIDVFQHVLHGLGRWKLEVAETRWDGKVIYHQQSNMAMGIPPFIEDI